MTYKQILKELNEIGLKKEFTSEFENYISPELLKMFKDTDKINSTANLIRLLLKKYEIESKKWLEWQKVLIFFMTPKFARNINQLL